MDPLGILANDLRAACSCGALFAARGARTSLRIGAEGSLPKPGQLDVLIVCPDEPGESADRPGRTKAAALAMRKTGWPLGLLLMESADPAELLPLIDAMLASGASRVWVAPGSPIDPSKLLPLAPEAGPFGSLSAATLDQGTPAVAALVGFERARGCRVIVSEASTPRQLRIMARLLREREIAEPRELLVGRLALARELAGVLASSLSADSPKQARVGTLASGSIDPIRRALGLLPYRFVPPDAPTALRVSSDSIVTVLQALGATQLDLLSESALARIDTCLADGPYRGTAVVVMLDREESSGVSV